MPRNCAVKSCREYWRTAPEDGEHGVSLHLVPEPPDKQLWEQSLGVTLWNKARVCSRHFSASCFLDGDDPSRAKRILKPGSVPTILQPKCRRKLLSENSKESGTSPPAKKLCETPGKASVNPNSSLALRKTSSVIIRPQVTNNSNITIKPRIKSTETVSVSPPSTEVFSKLTSGHSEPNSSSTLVEKIHETSSGISQIAPDTLSSSSPLRETCNVIIRPQTKATDKVFIKRRAETVRISDSSSSIEMSSRQLSSEESSQSPPAKKVCETHTETTQIPPFNPTVSSSMDTSEDETLDEIPATGTTADTSASEGKTFRDTASGVFTFLFVFFLICACYMYSLVFRRKDSTAKKTGSPILGEEDLRKKLLDESKKKREEKRKKAESEITPRKAKLREKLSKKNRKLKTVREENYRKKKKIAKMGTIIGDLKERKLMASDDLQLLESIGGPHKEFLERQISKVKDTALRRKYEDELRTFALTLHFKSPAAYEYVRTTFHLALPHPNTIYKWYRVIDGNPGFTNEAFEALQEKYRVDNPENSDPVFGSLIIDEMSIRKSEETDGKRYYGHVDFGEGLGIDDAPFATKALVIMLVCVNGAWKIPLGYFLTRDTTGEEQAGLIKTCLRLLNKTRVRVVSLTADGTKCNISMFKHLGCNFDSLSALKTWFVNPCNQEKICVFLDTSHMIKLVRNTLGDKGFLFHFKEMIRWAHIKKLFELQDREGLRLANKVTSKHIFYGKFKMKVCLATQVLSDSVAAALKVLMDLKLSDFTDAIGTINFIKTFNKLFDIFNSKNLKQLNFKAPVTKENYEKIKEYLASCVAYIMNLTCAQDGAEIYVTDSKRKTDFIGFLIAVSSLHGLYEMLVVPGLLDYLPMYKFCQDHLEMFFGLLRARNGFNNNPTARQLKAAYKKLLVHMQLKPSLSGNCVPIENISILTCSSRCPEKVINVTSPEEYVTELNDDRELQEYLRWYDCTEEKFDHNYAAYSFNPMDLTEVTIEILKYIAGFIVFRLNKVLKCQECIEAINAKPNECGKSRLVIEKNWRSSDEAEKSTTTDSRKRESEGTVNIVQNVSKHCEKIVNLTKPNDKGKSSLIVEKKQSRKEGRSRNNALNKRPGLTEATEDVIDIVKHCEKIVRTAHARSCHEGMREQDTPEKLANDALKLLYETNRYVRYFRDYEDHFADQEAMFSHKFYLVKSICLRFIMLRVHHINRNAIDKSKSKRQFLNKLILFQGS